MSRIHEAIKRAEQERAAGQSAHNGEAGVVERAAASSVIEAAGPLADFPSASGLQSELGSQPKKKASPEPLQFEEIWANCSRPQWKPDSDILVFSNTGSIRSGTEQFRTLRSRLDRMRDSQALQTILVSSAIPTEGKTVITSNLAFAMVRQRGSRVLLIDADLRSPRAHALLGAPKSPGLADYLQKGASEFEVIQRGPEEGLCFVPAGNHVTHPSELISSDRMKQFLERVKPAFDWIIIDSPPALPVADASVLGRLCDGVLLVVRANSTPSVAAQKAAKELRDTHILGVVLNTVEDTSEYGTYYAHESYGLLSSSKPQK